MISTTLSINGISIRLTGERWSHIVEEHCELAGMQYDVMQTVATPDTIYEGNAGEYLAVKRMNDDKSLIVVYKENLEENDGFVITAIITSRTQRLFRRKRLWP